VTAGIHSAATTRPTEIAEGLAYLSGADPVMAALIAAHPGYDHDAWRAQLPVMDLFGCLVFQIVGQQISMTAAGAIMGRLTARSKGRIPSPEQLRTLDEATLREIGMSWRKAATLRDLAGRFTDGLLSEKGLAALSDEAVVAELTEVPGIGPWTVHGALLIHLRRADVVATGDVMLQAVVQKHYGLDHRPTEDEFLAIAQPWHPHGSLAANLLFADAERDLTARAAEREAARIARETARHQREVARRERERVKEEQARLKAEQVAVLGTMRPVRKRTAR